MSCHHKRVNYPTRLLSDDESIDWECRPHWRGLIVPVLLLLVLAFAGTWAFVSWGAWFSGPLGSVGRWVILGVGVLIFIVMVLRPFLHWFSSQYVITNRRIIVRSGMLAKSGRVMPLGKINKVFFNVSILGRLLNYGRLDVESASDDNLIIRDVPDVEIVQQRLSRLQEADEDRRRPPQFPASD